MSNQSASLSSSMTRKVMRILKENGPRSEEYRKMQMRKKIQPLIIISKQLRKFMGLSLESSRIKVVVGNR